MDSTFRNAAFGGFNRQDVTDYLARSAEQHQKELDELRRQLEDARRQADGAEDARRACQERADQLEQDLAEALKRAEAAEGERDELARARAGMEERCADADRLKADAEAYALLKKTAADVEMDARCRAREIIDRAQAQADRTKVLAANWMGALRQRYGESRSQVDAAVAHAAVELAGAVQTLQQIQRHMEAQAAALDGLDKEDEN